MSDQIRYDQIAVLDYQDGGADQYSETRWTVQVGTETWVYEEFVAENTSGSNWYDVEGEQFVPDVLVLDAPGRAEDNDPKLDPKEWGTDIQDFIDDLIRPAEKLYGERIQEAYEVFQTVVQNVKAEIFPFHVGGGR